jgi:hypothetical protein
VFPRAAEKAGNNAIIENRPDGFRVKPSLSWATELDEKLNRSKRPCEWLALANTEVEAASGVHYSSRVVALESSQWIAYRQWPPEV